MTAEDIIHDLLEHPYPHDLMAIRSQAAKYSSEAEAMIEMDAYCAESFAMKARADWQNAQDAAREWLKNNQDPLTAIKDADSALRKCLNHLLMQPTFARNSSDIEREAETMESVHVALTKLQPLLKP